MAGIIVLVIAFLIALTVIIGAGIFNKLVKLKNLVNASWSDIDVQLKKRYDLVPNLVEVVKGAGTYEKTTLEAVIKARSAAMGAAAPGDKAKSEGMLTDTLKSLFALSESYPTLKANENYLLLQNQLKELEDGIERSRRYYNAVVRDFNTLIESFPSSVVASAFNFKQAEFFGLSNATAERQPVKAQL
ncbi:MAG: LemA family protein [Deltaproteobacteria bacterium]|nr:LemA family protein [Deltaproteobacteria bacterium]